MTVVSATEITATSPATLTAGPVNVEVTTAGGTSKAGAADEYTYLAAPTVTKLTPAEGPEAGKTTVTIEGSGFTGVTAVSFGATAATKYKVESPTTIVAEAPAGKGTAARDRQDAGRQERRGPGRPLHLRRGPHGHPLNVKEGPLAGGTKLTITGTGFTAGSTVSFGGTKAKASTFISATELSAESPAGTGTVNVTVTSAGGTSTTSAADDFSYVSTPTVAKLTPAEGPEAGKTTVTIEGSGFTGATAVSFGATPATKYKVESATSISAEAPAGKGTAAVTVKTPGGTSAETPADLYTYDAVPTVTSIAPAEGPLGGATKVIVKGSGFTPASTVTFGATPAAGVIVDSATEITATSPATLTAGPVNVEVTTAGGTSKASAADEYTYVATPTVSKLTPTEGPEAGKTVVVIEGTSLGAANTVRFGGIAATTFKVNSATSITATAPPGKGTVAVTVTAPGGTSGEVPADLYTYDAVPTVAKVTPAEGPDAGNTVITIEGTGLSTATAVRFGGVAAAAFKATSATSITATAPAGAGIAAVTVTTPGGTSAETPADLYTYDAVPTVTSLSVKEGPLAGGTKVTITGTGFTAGSTVSFGATKAKASTFISATELSAESPAGTGAAAVTVETPGGKSAEVPADIFTYLATPTVTKLTPAEGPEAGGTKVTITGTGFTAGSTVSFGATKAKASTFISATELSAESPAGKATAAVTVTTPGGTSAETPADLYTYDATPTVTKVTPAEGPLAGGTKVTITGTGFTAGSTVSFGATKAKASTFISATELSAESPAGAATVNVTVTSAGGTSATSAADDFTYASAPVVSSVEPAEGPAVGKTKVTVKGSGFTSVSAVRFGGTAGTALKVESPTVLTIESPLGTGTVAITIEAAGGTSKAGAGDLFTYDAVPTVTALSVKEGPLTGATKTTITGTGFTPTAKVSFGATAAKAVEYLSATELRAESPVGTGAGAVNVTVETPGGTSAETPADLYTYDALPTVTGIAPAEGPLAGATKVIVKGSGFTATSTVAFGVTPAAGVIVDSATEITATSPATLTAGPVNVEVTTAGGTSKASAADEYTYFAAPTVTKLDSRRRS